MKIYHKTIKYIIVYDLCVTFEKKTEGILCTCYSAKFLNAL